MSKNSHTQFQIYQMVVKPEYQGQGLGTQLIRGLIKEATDRGASSIILNARVTKVGFYQKFGFKTVGNVFASSETEILHIKMHGEIL